MSRPVRSVMAWTSTESTDPDGKVVWWTRLGDHQAELHHLGPYRARLRVWGNRGKGQPVLDVPVPLPSDNRRFPLLTETEGWLAVARQATLGSPSQHPSSGGATANPPLMPAELESRWLDDVHAGDRLLRAMGRGEDLADAVDDDPTPVLAAEISRTLLRMPIDGSPGT